MSTMIVFDTLWVLDNYAHLLLEVNGTGDKLVCPAPGLVEQLDWRYLPHCVFNAGENGKSWDTCENRHRRSLKKCRWPVSRLSYFSAKEHDISVRSGSKHHESLDRHQYWLVDVEEYGIGARKMWHLMRSNIWPIFLALRGEYDLPTSPNEAGTCLTCGVW